MKKNKIPFVQPFLKWAGGKRQLLYALDECVKGVDYKHYYEPFVGGGSFFLHLQPKSAVINDYNRDLISCYEAIRDDYDLLISKLKEYDLKKNKDEFYIIREYDRNKEYKNWSNIDKAARLIYLNKVCFNGLFRINSSGFFNTPYGKNSQRSIFNEEVLKSLNIYFNNNDIKFMSGDFEDCCKNIKRNSLIYFDPPYDQHENKTNFIGYTEIGFTREDQKRLRNLCDSLIEKKCTVIISNSCTSFIKNLYKDRSKYEIKTVQAKRTINSDPLKRGEIDEVLIIGKK